MRYRNAPVRPLGPTNNIHRLCSTLGLHPVCIARLHPQPDDENYSLALDFCLQKAYYHSFADVNPRQTEEFYAE